MNDPTTTEPQMPLGDNTPAFSVSELSMAIRRTVEGAFGRVRVRAEISRPTYARSGHLYVALKDENSVIDGVCWKGSVNRLSIRAEEGMEVIVTGKLTTYPGSSKYQIVIEQMELAGEGALLKMLEERKRKLAAEGLFDADKKQPLPFLPNRIAVVTSPTGAVIRDILHRLSDRFPIHVMVWPTQVQGQGAAEKIAFAIQQLNRLPETHPDQAPDLIIVARGGGSLEDLWCFNEEVVVRAAADSQIPLISAIGHETDTTLIDFVSDVRAPTPTAAAEIAVPVRAELVDFLADLKSRSFRALTRQLDQWQSELGFLSRALGDPARRIDDLTQRLDDQGERLHKAATRLITDRSSYLVQVFARLRRPDQILELRREGLNSQTQRLAQVKSRLFTDKEQQVATLSSLLEGFHKAIHLPLENGYAMVKDLSGNAITSAAKAGKETDLRLTFADGSLDVANGQSQPLPKPKKTVGKPTDRRQGELL